MTTLTHIFEPITIGGMALRNRVMLPPHGAVIGNLWGAAAQAEQNVAYWASRARDGAAWIDGITGFVDHTGIVPPGFVPSGSLGAELQGVFRMPHFVERAGRYAEAIHQAGACATTQLVLQGGLPHAPSATLANYTNNTVPHVLTVDEIRWLVDEYAFSAKQSDAAGLDGLEIHANHEDIMQLFLSPATNLRDDGYGGDLDGRLRFIREALEAMRAETRSGFTLGIRFNMDELFDGGYGVGDGIEIAKALEATGHVDYIHGVMGNNWGAPSYIQPHHYRLAEWSDLAGRYREALGIPFVYTGRVSDVATAEEVIARGQADVVGMARAMFAESNIISKAHAGTLDQIRPCIGCNDCLHAVTHEGMPFGCSVNPRTGRETEPEPEPARARKRVLVVGGGPAGLEAAALLAERGHDVSLWEREDALGGQVRIAARARENASFAALIDFQASRLDRLGVEVTLAKEATERSVVEFGADVVVVATGARGRIPDIEGVHAPFVVEGRDAMLGAEVGERVAVVAREDHMQPLTIAGHLVDEGKQVQLIYQTPGIAPFVGKYSIGAPLAKFSAGGGTVRMMERVVEITQGCLHTRNVYSGKPGTVEGFDTVVLACGGEADSALYESLIGKVDALHLLGDAFAPRRIWFATRQAYELAQVI